MAAKYRKVDPRIWNDAKFCDLSDRAKLVFLMLLTHPSMTALGAMRNTLAGLAEELRWDAEVFREAFREASQKGMVEHDAKACLIALPKFIKYNPPESPNVVKAWRSSADLLPECELKSLVIKRAEEYTKGLTKGFREGFREVFPKSMPNQEQEQEQEQEVEDSSEPPAATHEPPATRHRKQIEPDPTPVVMVFPCTGSGVKEWPLHQSKIDEWKGAYPGIDVVAECCKALQWSRDNPTKTKTARGMTAFLNRWLARAQDSVGRLAAPMINRIQTQVVPPRTEERFVEINNNPSEI